MYWFPCILAELGEPVSQTYNELSLSSHSKTWEQWKPAGQVLVREWPMTDVPAWRQRQLGWIHSFSSSLPYAGFWWIWWHSPHWHYSRLTSSLSYRHYSRLTFRHYLAIPWPIRADAKLILIMNTWNYRGWLFSCSYAWVTSRKDLCPCVTPTSGNWYMKENIYKLHWG